MSLLTELKPDVTIVCPDVLFAVMAQTSPGSRSFPRDRIVLLLERASDDLVFRALQAGVCSFLLRSATQAEVLETIRSIFRGRRHVPPRLAERLAERVAGSALTGRELQVIRLVSRGRSNKRIAAALGIEEGTVKVHLKNILSKLGASDRTQAVTTALRRGVIELD